jgi:hypothetical protein
MARQVATATHDGDGRRATATGDFIMTCDFRDGRLRDGDGDGDGDGDFK